MSRRYGAEDWDGLLKWVCEVPESGEAIFQRKLTAESEGDGKKNTVYHIAPINGKRFS